MAVCGYIIADNSSKDCVIIDPSTEPEKILNITIKKKLKVKAVINTHGHGDHTAGNAFIIKKTRAPLYIHKEDGALASKLMSRAFSLTLGGRPTPAPDFFVEDKTMIHAGTISIEVLHTPGHTKGSISLFIPGHVFTGDTLFVGDVGRTDLPGGSFDLLKKSIHEKLLTLPDETIVWPGHKYSESRSSSIRKEKETNTYI